MLILFTMELTLKFFYKSIPDNYLSICIACTFLLHAQKKSTKRKRRGDPQEVENAENDTDVKFSASSAGRGLRGVCKNPV